MNLDDTKRNMTPGTTPADERTPDGRITEFLRDSGLAAGPHDTRLTPLSGGVGSDIWKVETPARTFVVKTALPRLRVPEIWNAPPSRNASEAEWMATAARIERSAVPEILARNDAAGVFAMTYFDPAEYPVWKDLLRTGHVDPGFAALTGKTVALIHAVSARSSSIARRFADDKAFHALRIEPYLETTARRHPDLRQTLHQLAEDTLFTKRALVHGDISPKNILVGPRGPVFLDAECACFGDPAFDLSFCLTHLLLKCLWLPALCGLLSASFEALAAGYLAAVNWEPPDEVEHRAARLLPALLLARVDGKSPVEYLDTHHQKELVRRVTRVLFASPPSRLADVRHVWIREITA